MAGTGRFNVDPNVLKYTQRYSVDERALSEIVAAGSGVKRQIDPYQMAGGVELGRDAASRANDLLAQAEAAARAGDFTRADQLYAQSQQIISGVSSVAQGAFNLTGGEESAAAIRASSTEGRIVGRQLLTARELGDPNSATSTSLRGRLLDPALAAIDENTRNAERAITAERSEIEGQIRQQSASGGTGVNARADLALRSQAASQAALQRAVTYSEAGAQRAALTSQISLYLNEFSKRVAEDSVRMAQAWVNGTAGVRDEFQRAMDELERFSAIVLEQRAQLASAVARQERDRKKARDAFRNELYFGAPLGILTAGGSGGPTGRSSGIGSGGGGGGGAGGGGGESPLGGGFASGLGSDNAVGEGGGGGNLGDFGEQGGGDSGFGGQIGGAAGSLLGLFG